MDNWEGATPWKKRQARWSIPDLTTAIRLQCRWCNGAELFNDANDCVSHVCPLYPYRPGTCRPAVEGTMRATRRATTHGFARGARRARQERPLESTDGPESIPGQGVAS